MNVLVVGASGLIGAAVVARLVRDGHQVTALVRGRDPAARRLPAHRLVEGDLRRLLAPDAWAPLLADAQAVVNCAGVLQDSGRDSTVAVHSAAPAALWQAAETAGIRRVIHVSAIGVDQGGITPFSRTKSEAEARLEASGLAFAILRPSVVVGRQAYGGSALFRGLAALPFAFDMPEAGPLDIVQLDDVAETVCRLLRPDAPARIALDLAGPERLDFGEVIAAYRAWLGWRPARRLSVPGPVLALGWRLGDLAGWFGWRPPIRSTARREMVRGATGDGRAWAAFLGRPPTALSAALAAEPASVQERWFARLYLLKPLLLFVFAAFWLITGLVSLGPGWSHAVGVMRMTPAASLSEVAVLGGALLDLGVGLAILFRRTARAGLFAALGVSLLYILLGTLLLPALWADSLGPMMKVWPILALNLACLAVLDDR